MPAPVDLDALAAQFGGTSAPPSPPPTPATAHPDYDALAAQFGGTSAPPAPPSGTGGLGGWARKNLEGVGGPAGWENPEAGGLLAGGVMRVGSQLGTVADLVSRTGLAKQHLQDAAKWLHQGAQPQGLWENVGATGTDILELLGTDGLISLAGKAAAGTETGSAALAAVKNLKGAQQVGEFLAAHPKIAGLVGIGLKATRDATTFGGQTYLTTEDPEQAKRAAVLGGVTGVAAGTVAEVAKGIKGIGAKGAAATAEKAAQAAEQAPTTTRIGGVDVPVLKQQLTPEGGLTGITATAEGRPEVAEAQQEALQNVVRNSARNSLRTTLEYVNRTRPVYEAGNRVALPAPSDARPFTFTLEGLPTTEMREGQLTYGAQPIPPEGTTTPASYGPSETPWPRGEGEPQPSAFKPQGGRVPGYMHPGVGGVDQRTEMEMLEGAPTTRPKEEGQSDIAKGGGTLTTKDPHQAEQWLQQLDKLSREPGVDSQAIDRASKSLEDQLGLYHSGPYTRRFDPVNVDAVVGMTNTYGEAGAQAHGAVRPVYEKINEVTGGQFNELRGLRDRALNIIRDYKSSGQDLNAAHAELRSIDSDVASLFNGARGVNLNDLAAAQGAWKDGIGYNDLDAVIERMANGVTLGDTQSGLKRVVTGSNEAFESYLREGNNRANIERLIGPEGVTDLKKMFQLTSDAKLARKTSEVVENVEKQGGLKGFLKRYGKPGEALAIISAYGHPLGGLASVAGMGYGKGMAVGAGLGLTHFFGKQIVESAATNGRVINMIDFAVRHNMDPRIYAPLIARAMMVPMQEQAPQQQPQEQPQQ